MLALAQSHSIAICARAFARTDGSHAARASCRVARRRPKAARERTINLIGVTPFPLGRERRLRFQAESEPDEYGAIPSYRYRGGSRAYRKLPSVSALSPRRYALSRVYRLAARNML